MPHKTHMRQQEQRIPVLGLSYTQGDDPHVVRTRDAHRKACLVDVKSFSGVWPGASISQFIRQASAAETRGKEWLEMPEEMGLD